MRPGALGWFGIGAMSWAVAGCQGDFAGAADHGPVATAPAVAVTPAVVVAAPDAPPAAPIDWAGAGDCLGQLRLLQAAAAAGRLDERHEPPFAVAPGATATDLAWIKAATVPVVEDLPLPVYEEPSAAAAAAPCLLVVEPARDLRVASRVIDYEDVASSYQSGVRTERNPDYEAAQERLRDAKRDSEARGASVLRVGDPMLDLVGTLVGGVIAAFGEIGDNAEVEGALATLKETPRSHDQPVYRAYEFGRSTVRVGKEAIIPVALRDVRRGRVWRSQVRQRELRQFAVLDRLDARDPDYEQHRAGGMSRRELEHWQQRPPQLPLTALVAALVEPGDAIAPAPGDTDELVAMPADPTAGEDADIEPAAGPPAAISASLARSSPAAVIAAPTPESGHRPPHQAGSEVTGGVVGSRLASLVRLTAGDRSGTGFYVKPRLVATTADIVGTASVIDVTAGDGGAMLGLVALVDPIRNLAVVHVPRVGPPLPIAATIAGAAGPGAEVVELGDDGHARVTTAAVEPGRAGLAPGLRVAGDTLPIAAGAPVLVDGRAVGLIADDGGGGQRAIVSIDDLSRLLAADTLAALP